MDNDISRMSRRELEQELRKVRSVIRAIRDAQGHQLCWYQPELWALLPEGGEPNAPEVPKDFIAKCKQFHAEITGKKSFWQRWKEWLVEQFTV